VVVLYGKVNVYSAFMIAMLLSLTTTFFYVNYRQLLHYYDRAKRLKRDEK